jgi:hypothetical protein
MHSILGIISIKGKPITNINAFSKLKMGIMPKIFLNDKEARINAIF